MVCWLRATSSNTLLTQCYFPNPFLYLEKEATPFYSGHNEEFIMGHRQGFPLNFFSQANNKLKVCSGSEIYPWAKLHGWKLLLAEQMVKSKVF